VRSGVVWAARGRARQRVRKNERQVNAGEVIKDGILGTED
jgi:hypothetical protein